MNSFGEIIIFLFSGIGATLVGLVIREMIRKGRIHSGHLGNKTTIITERKKCLYQKIQRQLL